MLDVGAAGAKPTLFFMESFCRSYGLEEAEDETHKYVATGKTLAHTPARPERAKEEQRMSRGATGIEEHCKDSSPSERETMIFSFIDKEGEQQRPLVLLSLSTNSLPQY